MKKFLLLFGTIYLASCQFEKPILSFRTHKHLLQTAGTKYYVYPSFRTGIHIGLCSVTKTYDSHNRLIGKSIYKKTIKNMFDGNVRFYNEDIVYDSLGKKTKVHRYIFQNEGIGGYVILDTNITLKQ